MHRALALAPELARPLGPAGADILFADGDATWVMAADGRGRPRQVAPHRPASHLLPSPDGTRAVGRYLTPVGIGVFGFRLDGQGARRKLGGDAVPAVWSADSQWVLLQSEAYVCVVRAVGGEQMCWDGYVGLAFAPDSQHVLLARVAADSGAADGVAAGEDGARDLYIAPIRGASPPSPRLVLRGVPGPATWVPLP
jgi:hypothetical protein